MKKEVTVFSISLGVLLQASLMSAANAQIFKCTNASGQVYYNDKPCPVVDNEKKMRSEKDVVNGYAPPLEIEGKKTLKKGLKSTFKKQSKTITKTAKKKSNGTNKNSSLKNNSKLKGKSQRGNGSASGINKKHEEASKQPLPTGNYADRKRTIEDKRAYLGIRKDFE